MEMNVTAEKLRYIVHSSSSEFRRWRHRHIELNVNIKTIRMSLMCHIMLLIDFGRSTHILRWYSWCPSERVQLNMRQNAHRNGQIYGTSVDAKY